MGIGLLVGGSALRAEGDAYGGACGAFGCSGSKDAEGAMLRSVGASMQLGGALFALGGIALGVVAVATRSRRELEAEAKAVPVAAATAACPRCAADVPTDARFCAACGHAFVRPCPSCSRDLARSARFCQGCGAAVAPIAP